ncbi:MAG: hypothetical protein ABGW76_11625 [Mesonia sp.]|uniref:hypothetical protein n=1 Tax=Mesonia sp. TaxID=1960830 RepID=UPI003242F7DA
MFQHLKTNHFIYYEKIVLIAAIAVCGMFSANAQEESGQTSKGKWLVEANTNFGAAHAANTGISFYSVNGNTSYSVGFEGGYFVMDNLAIKAGLGYQGSDSDAPGSSSFSYKVGGKYYILGNIPVQLDYSGASIKDYDENPSYLGFQAGYALFLGEKVSVEPGLRYNMSMNDDFYESVFQINVGFALHF